MPEGGDLETADDDAPQAPLAGPPAKSWLISTGLFAATTASVLLTGAGYVLTSRGTPIESVGALAERMLEGWVYALPLLAILLCHEFGHFITARIHGVDASPPYFLPAPLLSPFGTMGAVIAMRGRIRSRNALCDVGASGPLAGLLVALPVLAVGLAASPVEPVTSPYVQEGQSLIYLLMKRLVLGPIPDGHDVVLGPVAFAGWVGLFVTALNLLPVGQLDGGHIAYALFGKRQDRYGRMVHLSLLGLFAGNVAWFVMPVLFAGGDGEALARGVGNASFWLVWFGLLALVRRYGGKEHPPTDPSELSQGRRVVAWVCLGLFVGLFMPAPWTVVG